MTAIQDPIISLATVHASAVGDEDPAWTADYWAAAVQDPTSVDPERALLVSAALLVTPDRAARDDARRAFARAMGWIGSIGAGEPVRALVIHHQSPADGSPWLVWGSRPLGEQGVLWGRFGSMRVAFGAARLLCGEAA